MDDGLVERIVRESGVPGLVDVLAERLAPTDLRSLLLAVFRRRAATLSPADVLGRWERDRFVVPSPADPAALAELDLHAFSLLPPGWERVELSPVAPLGTSAALAGLSQDLAVTTTRGTEVLADSTVVLSLEAALRRRADRGRPVRLCATGRMLRGQPFEPPFRQHFRLLGLVAADRAGQELALLVEQVDFHLRVLAGRAPGLRLAFTDLDGSLGAEATEALAPRHPGVELAPEPDRRQGRGYYERACFAVYAGDGVMLVDGGFAPWTQLLLSDRRERLLVSGLGTEMLCTSFP